MKYDFVRVTVDVKVPHSKEAVLQAMEHLKVRATTGGCECRIVGGELLNDPSAEHRFAISK